MSANCGVVRLIRRLNERDYLRKARGFSVAIAIVVTIFDKYKVFTVLGSKYIRDI